MNRKETKKNYNVLEMAYKVIEEDENLKYVKKEEKKEIATRIAANIICYNDTLKINKKIIRNKKVKILKGYLEEGLKNIRLSIDMYKELYKKTEFWEEKSEFEFLKKEWDTIRKVNGKLTRYYNELEQIKTKIERRENEI